jgi:hypothetical protein
MLYSGSMSITPTTMKCPVCPEQNLETLTSPSGSLERCPNCLGLFIPEDLIVAASKDRDKCVALLAETKALRLPTDKWCPKCLQKLFDGRITSRGLICTLCPVCNSHWTNLSALADLEGAIESSISLQIEAAANVSSEASSGAGRLSYEKIPPANDAGLGHLFRSFARVFDNWADTFSGGRSEPAAEKPVKKPEKIQKPAQKPVQKPAQKPLIVEVQPPAPSPIAPSVNRPTAPVKPVPEPPAEAPHIEIPEFVFPEEPKDDEIPVVEVPIDIPKPVQKVEPKPEPIPEPKPQPTPESKPEPEPEPKTKPKFEIQHTPEPVFEEEPAPERVLPRPAPKPAPKPEAPKPFQPVRAISLPQPSDKKPGFLSKLKAAWSPAPKKTVKPLSVVKPPAMPQEAKVPEGEKLAPSPAKLAPLPKPEAKPKPTPTPKPKPAGEGFFSKLFAPKKPIKKPPVLAPWSGSPPAKSPISEPAPDAAPAPMPAPSEIPAAKSPEPVKQPEPITKAPTPAAKKPAPTPKVKKPKVPSTIDHLAVWPPWILVLVAVICSSFRDFGFEPLPAVLWGLAGWSIGFMVRIVRLYPFQSFEETDLNALAGRKESAIPVILRGQIVPADELKPKGEVVFKQDERIVRLNPISTWDILPRLFGLSNPRQFLQGEVTLEGWYRPGLNPALEVRKVQSEKTTRTSMVKSLRWASAIFLLALAVIVSLALE